MSEHDQRQFEEPLATNAGVPVPAARPLNEFSTERIGDNVVLFDDTLNRYHTINAVAYDIWRVCDGVRSADQIAATVGVSRDVVEAAVEQLGEAGLLVAPETSFESTMHRRKMMKLAAAGAIGAVGIPVVASITRVGPEAAATTIPPECAACAAPGGDKCCCFHDNNGNYDCANRNGCDNGQGHHCIN